MGEPAKKPVTEGTADQTRVAQNNATGEWLVTFDGWKTSMPTTAEGAAAIKQGKGLSVTPAIGKKVNDVIAPAAATPEFGNAQADFDKRMTSMLAEFDDEPAGETAAREPNSPLRSFGLGARDAATLGLDVNAMALGDVLENDIGRPTYPEGMGIATGRGTDAPAVSGAPEDVYVRERDEGRQDVAQAFEDNPWWFGGGSLVGGIPLAAATGGASTVGKARSAIEFAKLPMKARLLQAAKTGAVAGTGYGAASGYGHSDVVPGQGLAETAGEFAGNTAEGAAMGGATGAVAGPVMEGLLSTVRPYGERSFTNAQQYGKGLNDISAERFTTMAEGGMEPMPLGYGQPLSMMPSDEALMMIDRANAQRMGAPPRLAANEAAPDVLRTLEKNTEASMKRSAQDEAAAAAAAGDAKVPGDFMSEVGSREMAKQYSEVTKPGEAVASPAEYVLPAVDAPLDIFADTMPGKLPPPVPDVTDFQPLIGSKASQIEPLLHPPETYDLGGLLEQRALIDDKITSFGQTGDKKMQGVWKKARAAITDEIEKMSPKQALADEGTSGRIAKQTAQREQLGLGPKQEKFSREAYGKDVSAVAGAMLSEDSATMKAYNELLAERPDLAGKLKAMRSLLARDRLMSSEPRDAAASQRGIRVAALEKLKEVIMGTKNIGKPSMTPKTVGIAASGNKDEIKQAIMDVLRDEEDRRELQEGLRQ